MEQVHGRENFFERAHGNAETDLLFRESIQSFRAYPHHAIQFVNGARSRIPEVGQRMRAAGRARIAIGNKHRAFVARFVEDGIEGGTFCLRSGGRRELRISVADGNFVPLADVGCVRRAQIDLARNV